MAVVVGFIPTPEGQAALVHGAEEARLRGAGLVVVASYDPLQNPDRAALQRFRDELAAVEERLAGAGLDFEVRQMARGRLPSEDILEVAEELDADLVVIGLRRRTAVGKLLLGSQAQQVLMDATCPVLCVKAAR